MIPFVVGAAFFLVTLPAFSAEIRVAGLNEEGRPVVSIEGPFVEGDTERFSEATRGKERVIVVLHSNGGDVQSAIEIGTRIRMRGFSTVVADNNECHSACALAWLGGVERFIGNDAVVSFHAAFRLQNGVPMESGVANALVGAYAANLGLGRDAVLFLTSAPPDEFNALTPTWARRIGLSVTFGTSRPQLRLQSISFEDLIPEHDKVAPQQPREGDWDISDAAAPYDEEVLTLIERAEQGDAEAQFKVGSLYEQGSGVGQNYARAAYWYLMAAEQGNAFAQYNIASMYYFGDGVSQDYGEAFRWYMLAAEQGLSTAQASLGRLYELGSGTRRDLAKALRWYHRAAEAGNPTAQNHLGRMYGRGIGVDRDYPASLHWHRAAAEQGYTGAQTSMALIYALGRGVAVDVQEAERWLDAAHSGGADDVHYAQLYIGFLYEAGHEVSQDFTAAARWYRAAAEAGLDKAQLYLGRMYADGRGVGQDFAEAAHWFRSAADQGDAEAQNLLGDAFFWGRGVERNHRLSAEWYRRAAEQGHAAAQYSLGYAYAFAAGVPLDYAAAVRWLERSAAQEYAPAQLRLGIMYMQGIGVRGDAEVAVRWISAAAVNENARAQSLLALLFEDGAGVHRSAHQAAEWLLTSLRHPGGGEIDWVLQAVSDLRRDTVRELQTSLAEAGHYRGSIDGLAGPMTREALRSYAARASRLLSDDDVSGAEEQPADAWWEDAPLASESE